MFTKIYKPVRLQIVLTFMLIAGAIGVSPAGAASSISFSWAKRIGSVSYDAGTSLAVDVNGNAYVTGNFSGTVDFNPGAGVYNLTSTGEADIYISKLNTNGSLLWAKRIGGVLSESGHDVAVDGDGNVYSIGIFYGTVDFDPGAGAYNLSSAGSSDVFISKLDANGNFVWAKNVGGTSNDYGNGLVADGTGNIYISGYFSDVADFDPSAGEYDLTSVGSDDIFISKFDGNGSLVWAKSMGGTSNDSGNALVVDESGNVYTIGTFWGTVDFDPGAGIYNLSSGGNLDIFISELNNNGQFVWAKKMGGTASDSGADIAIDGAGSVYSTGSFNGTADFDPGASVYNLTSNGYWDFFISKFDNDGNLICVKSMGGEMSDDSYGIAVDTSGNIYTTGGFVSSTIDFDPGTGIYNLTNAGNGDIFINKLNGNGEFIWAKSIGIDAYRNVYAIGDFTNTADFDP